MTTPVPTSCMWVDACAGGGCCRCPTLAMCTSREAAWARRSSSELYGIGPPDAPARCSLSRSCLLFRSRRSASSGPSVP
eukprot:14317894-Alexandrium_andersonii.AAC.1